MKHVFSSGCLSLVLAIAFLSAGCTAKGGASADNGTAASNTPPNWTLKNLDGKSVSLADFKGKVVALNFWATWCPPCRAEIPDLIELQKKYQPLGFTFVGISLDSLDPADIAHFAKEEGMNYPIVVADEKTAVAYGADQGIPETLVIGKDGRVLYQQVGIIDKVAVVDAIEKALKQ